MGGALQRYLGLMQNLARDVLLVIDYDSAGIDYLEAAPIVLGEPMDPIACDAGLISDNGAPLSRYPIKKGGLSNVRPAHNDHRGGGV